MSKTTLIIFLFLVLFDFTLILSRKFDPYTLKTTLLDVQASIQTTKNVLSFNPQTKTTLFDQQKQSFSSPSSSSSSLPSLQLHSRTSVHGSTHKDYRSLTLSRLARDSARVRYLSTRADLAINGVSKSDLKPIHYSGFRFKAEDLQAPVVSGSTQGSGEYFTRVGIGNPASEVYMVLDTGSDINWLQCSPCTDCYSQADPVFQPELSSSYSALSCDSSQCKSLDVSECRNDRCLYEVSYGDGSYTVGDFVTETVTIGSRELNNVAIGCGHNNEGLFVGAAGLLGLGGGSLSFPSQINATAFSYCLVNRDSDSASTLDFDTALPPNAVIAPLLRNDRLDTFFYVDLSGISVAGEMVPLPDSAFAIDESGNGGVIVDSGTAVTRLETASYESLRDLFVKRTHDMPLPLANGVALFDTCFNLSSRGSVEVPTVSFHFPEGKVLDLPAKNFLIPVDSDGTFCFAFAPTSSAISIIGNVQQQGTRVGYDIGNSLIGFSVDSC